MASRAPALMTAEQLVAPTTETVKEYQETLDKLVAQLVCIKEMTERYPVYLLLAGRAYRFDTPESVDRFVADLRAGIHSLTARA